MSQVINNLLSNAIKFTPEGGSIFLLAKKNSITRRPLGKENLQLTIKDTGIGVPQDKLDKIFNKYEQAELKIEKMVQARVLPSAKIFANFITELSR